ncbi:MAG: response regulator [Leptolyngbyaceae cyanobacterium MO_188.B28]|nr:response regulator [Leptolyngbyaceae cyanobacterium MO_188.B28]
MLLDDLKSPIDILLVEDNAGDVFLIENALRNCSTRHNLYLAEDRETAMRFLRPEERDFTSPCPQLIMLDLNLAGQVGGEVLMEIKGDPNLQHIPVIVLTEPASEQDMLRSYQLYANSYITKSADLNQYQQKIQSIGNYWLTCVQLPVKI